MLGLVRFQSLHMLLLAVLVTSGCGRAVGKFSSNVLDGVVEQPTSTVELLESELRWMEANLYRLDDHLEEVERQLDSTRRENAVLRLELAEAKASQTSLPSKADAPASHDSGPFDEEKDVLDDLMNFKIQLGNENPPTDPDVQNEDDPVVPKNEKAPSDERRIEHPVVPEGELPPSNGASDEVTQIKLNSKLTGGYNFDGVPGHEGVLVVVEPHDRHGEVVKALGRLRIEVSDPALKSPEKQIAKWDFDYAETASLFKSTLFGQGVQLQLPWPSEGPKNKQLDLSVAFEMPGGRRLTTQKRIIVEPTTERLLEKARTAEKWSPYRR